MICEKCGKAFKTQSALDDHMKDAHNLLQGKHVEPRWDKTCEVCGQSPTHPATGMCGPCTFGEAETIGGNW